MPKNCLVVGCGRSGTSCMMGSICGSGYNIGGTGHAGNLGNPKGYFETKEVNNINDTMLFSDHRSMFTQGSKHGWLTRFPVDECPMELPDTAHRIRAILSTRPLCLKDPRFSYTLPIWRRYLPDAKHICMIRHPGEVVNSILRNCATAPYLSNIQIDKAICYDIWRHMYTHLLRHANIEWVFVHYYQLLDGSKFDDIDALLDIQSDRCFPTKSLRRSDRDDSVPRDVMDLYLRICEFARYKEDD